MTSNLHPIMQQALAPFAPPAESAELAFYRKRLRCFDWQFHFSDDASAVRIARVELANLHRMQAELDPDGRIWRAVAPGGHGEPQPITKEKT
jgi:hypothetical protein